MANGTLYVVSTPIGNLEDLTHRALRLLKEVVVVAAEDTRHTMKLFHHYGIRTPLVSYHEHNKLKRGKELLDLLRSQKDVALVSDAGTPGISDPGYLLVRAALEAGVPVVSVPGASALTAALSVSGLPTAAFTFVGFLPASHRRRRRELEKLTREWRTVVFYESPHRLLDTLEDILEIMGDRHVVVTRELTKKFEDVVRGRVSEVTERFRREPPRGEFTVILEGAPRKDRAVGSDLCDLKYEKNGDSPHF